MTRFLAFTFLFIFGQFQLSAQCSNVEIQIPSYSETQIQLDNTSEFYMPPASALTYLYEISTTEKPGLLVTNTNENWILNLPANGLSTTDSIIVDLQVTSPSEVCVMRDTMVWDVVAVVLGTELFSWQALNSNTGTALPVELIEFTGELARNKILLDWTTGSEVNNDGFEIHKSNDGRNWESIGFVNGQGNSFIAMRYDFEDDNLFSGQNYYRLKQVDFSGAFDYSEIIVFEVRTKKEYKRSLYIYPNPSPNEVTISIPAFTNSTEKIEIFNMQGQLVLNIPIQDKQEKYQINSLGTGTYLVRMINGGQITTQKLVIQK